MAVAGRAERGRGGGGRLLDDLAGRTLGTESPPKLPFTIDGMKDPWSVGDGSAVDGRRRDVALFGCLASTCSGIMIDAGSNEGRNETKLEETVADLVR